MRRLQNIKYHRWANLSVLLVVLLAGCAKAAPLSTSPIIEPGRSPASPTTNPTPTATLFPDFPSPTTTLDIIPPTEASIEPLPPTAITASLPDISGLAWVPIVGGLDSPVSLAHAGDGSDRLFVIEQAGKIRVISDARILPDPYLDIRNQVGSQGNEQGLLGLAFHPRFSENGFFFVNFTNQNGDTVLSRFTQDPQNPARSDPASQRVLLTVNQPYANHNGGVVVFGPDGYLYLGLGDGGSANDPQGNGQSLDTLLGKVLRLDVDGGEPYAIPLDNPFVQGGGRPEIWAYGLRNPWRISFDRQTGDLYIADVGQNKWEEVNYMPAGSSGGVNFGWSYREGLHAFDGRSPTGLLMVDPVAEYSHTEGCSISGGVVYRGLNLPEMQGVYIYGDFCSGTIWGLVRTITGWQTGVLFQNAGNITTFGEDENGEVYLADRNGTIYQLSRKVSS